MYKMTTIKNTFDSVIRECSRSITKKNLHSDPAKEEVLAQQLTKIFARYGQAIAGEFQAAYEKKNPALSYLFSQVTNAVVEKTFHQGSCHAQAAYALIELTKEGIFNSSLIFSQTGNRLTEHFYLLILDEFILKRLPELAPESIYIRVRTQSISPNSYFFDTWSNQLCLFKDFNPQNQYTSNIINTSQMLFKPLHHLFKNEINVIENIIFCLDEYEKHLNKLFLDKETIPERITKIFTSDDPQFQDEIETLSDTLKCKLKLFLTIEGYKKGFLEQLNLLRQTNNEEVEKNDQRLSEITSSFYKEALPSQWRAYPQKNLTGKYIGHQVRFFTMPQGTSIQKAGEFVTYLNEKGLNVELKDAKGKPSVIVDLTNSTFNI